MEVYLTQGKTGWGQQGDHLEMLVFNLSILPWGATYACKVPGPVVHLSDETRSLAYADDGYIKTKTSVSLQVLADLKHILKEDAGIDLNVPKTTTLPKEDIPNSFTSVSLLSPVP